MTRWCFINRYFACCLLLPLMLCYLVPKGEATLLIYGCCYLYLRKEESRVCTSGAHVRNIVIPGWISNPNHLRQTRRRKIILRRTGDWSRQGVAWSMGCFMSFLTLSSSLTPFIAPLCAFARRLDTASRFTRINLREAWLFDARNVISGFRSAPSNQPTNRPTNSTCWFYTRPMFNQRHVCKWDS